MNLDGAVVFDESHLAEAVHEKAHARAGGADHLCKGLLADLRDHNLRLAFFPELREQEEYTS